MRTAYNSLILLIIVSSSTIYLRVRFRVSFAKGELFQSILPCVLFSAAAETDRCADWCGHRGCRRWAGAAYQWFSCSGVQGQSSNPSDPDRDCPSVWAALSSPEICGQNHRYHWTASSTVTFYSLPLPFFHICPRLFPGLLPFHLAEEKKGTLRSELLFFTELLAKQNPLSQEVVWSELYKNVPKGFR